MSRVCEANRRVLRIANSDGLSRYKRALQADRAPAAYEAVTHIRMLDDSAARLDDR